MSVDSPLEPASQPPSGVLATEVIHGMRCTWRVATFPAEGGPIAALFLAGDLDVSGRPTLKQAMEHVLAAEPHALVVDVGQVDFCGVAEASMIYSGGSVRGEFATRYAVSAVPAHMTRLFGWLGSVGGPNLYPSASAAVVALRAAL